MIKLPQPDYLNLEWWFAKFFEFLEKLPVWVSEIIERIKSLDLKIFSTILSSLFALGIIFVLYKIHLLNKRRLPSYLDFFAGETTPEERSVRWGRIKERVEMEDPNEWKRALEEADRLLDEILQTIGYEGEDMLERLKNIEPSDFDNLQNVWEAHRFKERLAKFPADTPFDKETAKKILEKYEKALKELKYI